MYFCVQLSDFLKCNFGQLHAIALKNAVCERRGMKYAFVRVTVRFFRMQCGTAAAKGVIFKLPMACRGEGGEERSATPSQSRLTVIVA